MWYKTNPKFPGAMIEFLGAYSHDQRSDTGILLEPKIMSSRTYT
jgi:hypothetical protein